MADAACCHCGRSDVELRSYGSGGRPICFRCMQASPEREAEAREQFARRLNRAAAWRRVAERAPGGPGTAGSRWRAIHRALSEAPRPDGFSPGSWGTWAATFRFLYEPALRLGVVARALAAGRLELAREALRNVLGVRRSELPFGPDALRERARILRRAVGLCERLASAVEANRKVPRG